MPLLISISFDEVDRLYSLYFMIILALLMSSTALLYLRGHQLWPRVGALLIGILSTTTITVIAPSAYWQQHGWHGSLLSPQVASAGVAVVLILFSPILIGLWHRAVEMRQAGERLIR